MSDLIQKKISKLILSLIAIVLIAYFSYLLINIFLIVAISILLGFIFAPFVRLLEGRGFSRTVSTLIIFAIFSFLIYLGLSVVIPKLFYQMNQLLIAMKNFSLNEELASIEDKILGVFPLFNKGELSQKVQTLISTSFNDAINHITQFLSGVISVIAVILIVLKFIKL
jgi:predicted PurR-regulated permease PerM